MMKKYSTVAGIPKEKQQSTPSNIPSAPTSVSGFQVVRFGQFWLMYELTESPLSLGYVGLAQALPGSSIFVLATLTLMDLVRVWHVMAIAFLAAGVNAFDEPARHRHERFWPGEMP